MEHSDQYPLRIGKPQELYRDAYQRLYRVHVEFDGFSKDYFVVDRGRCAAMVVVRAGDVLLVRQYRFVADRVTLELPSGKVDDGEEPLVAATRECVEEAGIAAHSPQLLISYHVAADTFSLPTFIYFADRFSGTAAQHTAWVPLSRCMEMIASGAIVDSLTIIGLSALERRRRA